MTFKFEILIFGHKWGWISIILNLFIFQSWIFSSKLFIYLIQIINEINPFKNDIHPYEIIHPCKWIKITLFFKFQVQNSMSRLHIHAQAIIYFFFVVTYIPRHMLFNFTHGIQGLILPNGFEAKSRMFIHNTIFFGGKQRQLWQSNAN
jgi:hypothetical protein